MGVIAEGIIVNSDNTISFGNHIATTKVKIDDYKIGEDTYKLRAYNEVTRLTINHILVFESTPGVTVHNFNYTKDKVNFKIEGNDNAQITLELEPNSEYKILLNGRLLDESKANAISGKLSFSFSFDKKLDEVAIAKL